MSAHEYISQILLYIFLLMQSTLSWTLYCTVNWHTCTVLSYLIVHCTGPYCLVISLCSLFISVLSCHIFLTVQTCTVLSYLLVYCTYLYCPIIYPSILCTVHCKYLYCPVISPCILYTVHCTLYIPVLSCHISLYTVHCTYLYCYFFLYSEHTCTVLSYLRVHQVLPCIHQSLLTSLFALRWFILI